MTRVLARDPYYYHSSGSGGGGGGGLVYRLVAMRCLADRLPWIFHSIVTNGKIAAVAVLGINVTLVALWVPFWLLGKVITEYGVYAFTISTIFLVGRSIIRLIAFPGSSQKVMTDIEAEFAKYCVQMITTAAGCLIDLGDLLDQDPVPNNTLHQLPNMWRRTKGYRDRVLGVFLDVLLYIYNQDSTSSLALSVETQTATNNDSATVTNGYGPGLTRYGNNRFSGDIGHFNGLTTKARMDGRELLTRLQRVLQLLDDLEQNAQSVLESTGSSSSAITDQARTIARGLKESSSELRDFVSSLRPPSDDTENGDQGEDPNESMRRKMEQQNATPMEAAKTAVGSILPMLDPAPHTSIFGFDVQRGCMLSRYRGARQFWVPRPSGGMIDVLHFPASNRRDQMQPDPSTRPRNPKAVLYCNPNAGLIEVAAGLSFAGGNVPTADPDNAHDDSWIDFYTELGIDVYVFNYAGYGRSFGTTFCVGKSSGGDQYTGCLARVGRIIRNALCTFTPSPDTLRADGVAVAQHLFIDLGIQQLIIHGESIGGMAASGTARQLSQSPSFGKKLSLLICDRTFCNLEAIAQRLVGGWTGYAIRCLTPFWNTDVAGDYLASTCPKILASDAADLIISEASSLKSGVALWKELHRGIATTKGIGWIPETPLQYRMADWENCCVNDSRYLPANSLFRAQPPVWPGDKHVSFEEAFHFAACCKRIAKFAKAAARPSSRDEEFANALNGSHQPFIMQAWIVLACCDGLTGMTLGVATKRGFDATVTWLCSCLVFGGQVIVERAEQRLEAQGGGQNNLEITPGDFDGRPAGYENHEQSGTVMFPKPIPVVLESLLSYLEAGDEAVSNLSHEFQFVVGILHYIQARLSAPATVQASQMSRDVRQYDGSGIGSFLDLHCGHNNPFSTAERESLKVLLDKAANSRTEENRIV